MPRITRIALICGALAVATAGPAAADEFPTRPIRLVSPFAPGGGNDILSRTVGGAMSRHLGHPVVVDNRPGGNTIVGTDLVAKAPADGHTLLMASSSLPSNATLYPKLPYDTLRDFAPVGLVATTPLIVAVTPGLAATSVRELVELARARPGQITYPSAGTGNSTHLAGELFAAMAGVTLLHVPYKGSSPGINDLIAGRVHVVFSTALAVLPHVRTGRLRALAVTTATRSSVMPELPTVAEAGVPGYEAGSWYGFLAPAGTPQASIRRLNSEMVRAVAQPDVKERLVSQGLDPIGGTPEAFAAYIRSEIAKWAKVIRTAGVKAE